MKLLVTGGAGFVGSHVAETYATQGHDVIVYDNLSRASLLQKTDKNKAYNWHYLSRFSHIKCVEGDIRDADTLTTLVADGVDIIVHTAAQTAVTQSVTHPAEDFSINAIGSFNLLEAARKAQKNPSIIYCSTNKVYGDNTNAIPVKKEATRYCFDSQNFARGIAEDFPIDRCKHTPYGCSKLAADLYMQDYAKLYGLKIGIFRMSCIYGPRQFGVEDQGWLAWFCIAITKGYPITIYGDGKQCRDVLYITDLIRAYDAFIASDQALGIFNIGGGTAFTLSLDELLDTIASRTGKATSVSYAPWRPSDQKVYVSDITKIKHALGWQPNISPKNGLDRLLSWIEKNKTIL